VSIGWTHTTWGDLVTLEYGKALRDYKASDGPVQVFGTNGPIGFTDKWLSEGAGVIVGRKGAYRGIHYSAGPFFVIDTAFYIRPKVPIDMRWAYYQLLTVDINGMDSGSAIPSTSRDDFYKIPVVDPGLTEQRRIASFLGALDERIELLRETNATLEGIAQALFKTWFVDFDPVRAKSEGRTPEGLDDATAALFPDTFQDSPLGPIPTGWIPSNVGRHFELTMGQSPPGSALTDRPTDLPFYQGSTDFGFRFPTKRVFCDSPTRLARPGDVLVSVRAPVGDINMAIEHCCIGRGVASVRDRSGRRGFAFHAIRAIRDQFETFNSEGTVFGSISKRDFESLNIVVPPVEEVPNEFERVATDLDEQVLTGERSIRTLSMMRDHLLPRLISGRLRLTEADLRSGRSQ
jgi:type I restriction enzyme, S subunit